MGDLSDMHDIERFVRSREGKEHLESIKKRLLTGRITDVTFTNGGTFRSEAPTADSGVQYNLVLAGTSSLSNSGTMTFV